MLVDYSENNEGLETPSFSSIPSAEPEKITAVTFNTACSVRGAIEGAQSLALAMATSAGKSLDKFPRSIETNAQAVGALGADIIALQEVCSEDLSTLVAHFPYASFRLAQRAPSPGFQNSNLGTFLATKNLSHPMSIKDVPPIFWGLTGRRDFHKKMTYLSLHGPHSPNKRKRIREQQEAWGYLQALIKKEQALGYDVLVLGDFNVNLSVIRECLSRSVMHADKVLPFVPAAEGRETFQLRLPGFRIPTWIINYWTDTDIDNELFFPVQEKTQVTSTAQALENFGTKSDHLLVMAEFKITR